MASQNYNAPDLNSILRTLSAFSNHPDQTRQNQTTPIASGSSYPPNPLETAHDNDHDAYEPPDAFPSSSSSSYTPVALSQTPQPSQQTRTPSSSSSTRPPQGIPASSKKSNSSNNSSTASSITTWPAALKQVMRTVAQNEDIQRRIRFLIQRQHDHEKQWWHGREALLQKQTARAEKKKELDEVLRSVGAPVDSKQVSTAEEDYAELQNYDAKVYKASRQMADAMIIELKALDIPFFCLTPSLVTESGSKGTESETSKSPPPSNAGPDKHRSLSKEELSALQLRILDLLQDLCKE